jgi:CRISPR/Cas system endoribonuclease Cas6 (RAMP superfamily)
MLLSLLLEIEPTSDAWWERPQAVNKMAYQLLSRMDPTLASELHPDTSGAAPEKNLSDAEPKRSSETQPFTLAPLIIRKRLFARFTGLTEHVSTLASEWTHTLRRGETIPLGASVIPLKSLVHGTPWTGQATYAALRRLPFTDHVSFRFQTSTSIKQGDFHMPLPVPDLLLRSWSRRWNDLCPPSLKFAPEILDRLAGRVGLEQGQLKIATRHLKGGGKIVGFTGEATLKALPQFPWNAEERVVFTALCAYSFYCGTGAKTTHGLGVTLPGDISRRKPATMERGSDHEVHHEDAEAVGDLL